MTMRDRVANKYAERNAILRRIGFSSYEDYLASSGWALIRRAVLRRDPICKSCGCAKSSQVHHSIYGEAQLKGKTFFGMVGVCRPCHERIEFDGDDKLAPDEAAVKLRGLGVSRDELLENIRQRKNAQKKSQ